MMKQCLNCQSDIPVTAHLCPHCGHDVAGALARLRVLDLTGPGIQYAGRLIADMGADVVKIEPPQGDEGRHRRPFAGDIPHPERSITFLTYNASKRSVVMDLKDDGDRQRFAALAAAADILLEDGSMGELDALGLGYDVLKQANPGLVYTSVRPFGLWGPYSGYLGGELIVQAVGGPMYGYGDPDQRPAWYPLEECMQLAAQHVAFASLIALRHAHATGRGQRLEVSIQEVLSNVFGYLGRYAAISEINRRPGTESGSAPMSRYPCVDGFCYLMPTNPRHVDALFEWMDNDILNDDVWKDRIFRRQNGDILIYMVSEFTANFTKQDLYKEAQRRHIPAAPLLTIEDLVNDEHLQARDYFQTIDHPIVGTYRTTGMPFRMNRSPWHIYRPAPRLGEHTAEVMEEWLASPRVRVKPAPAGAGNGDQPDLPLKGLRILDFSRVLAGPYMTRYLAELGAEVIKIESEKLPDRDQARQANGYGFAETNRSKKSIALDMTRPEALPLLERLIQVSDVIVENFRAGVLVEWGLGYERLHQLNPGIIYISMPGFGNWGPNSNHISYGRILLAYSGFTDLWGHPESPDRARPIYNLPDFTSASTGAFAVLSALEYRDRTGLGQMIELAQVESLVSSMGVAVHEYTINGRVMRASGNGNPNAAPHDAFPCFGDDAWCAIACYTEEQWRALCGVVGQDLAWPKDSRFATLDGRLEHGKELYEDIAAWTRAQTPHQAMRILQQAGVPAGIVANGEDVYYDINLRARDYVVTVDHSHLFGVLEHPSFTARLLDTPGRVIGPCPDIGEHNREVYGGILGLSDAEVQRLTEEKVFY